jgi:hypothetical protein
MLFNTSVYVPSFRQKRLCVSAPHHAACGRATVRFITSLGVSNQHHRLASFSSCPLTWRLDGLEISGVAKMKTFTLNENQISVVYPLSSCFVNLAIFQSELLSVHILSNKHKQRLKKYFTLKRYL